MCKDIYDNQVFSMIATGGEPSIFLRDIGNPSEISNCPSCKFLAAMANRGLNTESFHIRAFPMAQYMNPIAYGPVAERFIDMQANPDISDENADSDRPLLAVVSNNFVKLARADAHLFGEYKGFLKYFMWVDGPGQTNEQSLRFVGRRVLPLIPDFDFIRDWIQLCHQRHTNFCNQQTNRFVDGFKVIDCISRRVINAPKWCQYVTLSYVWGTCEQSEYHEEIPLSCPRVVEDAMTVTRQLSFKYLWIDRYCIDQRNEAEKHNQITNMDLIYSNAEVTLVAAAGTDGSFGLPGVSLALRTTQKHLPLQRGSLVSMLDNPCNSIRSSAWMSRGWTYQEGILSRRRLIFTAEQVYFQCSAMHCFENISIPLRSFHGKTKLREDFTEFRLFPYETIAKRPDDFIHRVNEYVPRSLSYESDILKAIAGVFKVFEQMSPPVYQLCGVPLFPLTTMKGENIRESSLKVNNLVSPTVSLATGLGWVLDQYTYSCRHSRRHGFPSWSWAGWSGWEKLEIKYISLVHQQPTSQTFITEAPSKQVEITFEDAECRSIPWSSLDLNSHPVEGASSTYFLNITCSFINLEIDTDGAISSPDITAFSSPTTFHIQWDSRINLTVSVNSIIGPVKALILARRVVVQTHSPGQLLISTICLLVQKESDYYTRIGLATWGFQLTEMSIKKLLDRRQSFRVG